MINVLTIKDISKVVKWDGVKRSIKYHHPTDKNNYENLFKSLEKRKKYKVKDSEYLHVSGGIDINGQYFKKYGEKYFQDLKEGNDVQYYGVSIYKTKEKCNYWGVDFLKWDYLVNLPIHDKTLEYLTFTDIVAHFLWEITFYGTEQQSLEHGKKLQTIVKEIKSGKAKTTPLEETDLGKLMQKDIDKKLKKQKNAKHISTK